jgi:hypothetical protein
MPEPLRPLYVDNVVRPAHDREYVRGAVPVPNPPRTEKRTRGGIACPDEADLAKDKEALETETSCVICVENKSCCIILPCAHMNLCVKCSRRLCDGKRNVECPICKKKVDEIKYVFT